MWYVVNKNCIRLNFCCIAACIDAYLPLIQGVPKKMVQCFSVSVNITPYFWGHSVHRTTLFFSSKSPTFHLSLDFSIFDVFSSNFSSMKMLFIDGAFSKFISALPPNALPPNAPPPNALPPKAYRPNAHRLTARRT